MPQSRIATRPAGSASDHGVRPRSSQQRRVRRLGPGTECERAGRQPVRVRVRDDHGGTEQRLAHRRERLIGGTDRARGAGEGLALSVRT